MNTNPQAKRIFCYGDSLTFGKVPGPTKRYPVTERWTGVLQSLLGEQYEVIEEGLRARTTDLDDPSFVGRNGLTYFQSSILSHLPVDLVILFIGTNDLKEKFNRTAKDIASTFIKYNDAIIFACNYLEENKPKVLIVCPPLIDERYALPEWGFVGGEATSKELSAEYARIAEEIGAEFIDLSNIISPSPIDGVHLDAENNKKVANLLAEKIKSIF